MDQPRHKGRFEKLSKIEWRKNVSVAVTRKWNKRKDSELYPRCLIDGNRIINLSVLAKELWCAECKIVLGIENIEKETMVGLASVFHVRCHQCLGIKFARTSTYTQKSKEDNRGCHYSINVKASAGKFTIVVFKYDSYEGKLVM